MKENRISVVDLRGHYSNHAFQKSLEALHRFVEAAKRLGGGQGGEVMKKAALVLSVGVKGGALPR
jgi:hypothetical protein